MLGSLHQVPRRVDSDVARRGVLASTDQVCRPLVSVGHTANQLALMRLGDVAPSPDRELLRARRRQLGLPSDDGSPLVIDVVTGTAVGVAFLTMHLRRARLSSIERAPDAALVS